ncbi:PREDICTED: putative B3 domain-containing protein At4g03160 [Camelina sativa]|uniref:B3 domain-containing protein At4g03160 n=1 Tax=Camelina sativa TaxID=90675 RepID=A0ABM1RSH5_CAMSA|nr:PREDICTED: putative B3 domain-containing protein At4g03160 [Camelina sativa]
MCSQTNRKEGRKKNKTVKEDDSEETLQLMLQWKANTPEKPPRSIFFPDPDVAPVREEAGENHDVLGKTDKLGIDGRDVVVYGPDVKTHGTHDMVFKMWGNRQDTPVLKSAGWREFVEAYDLKMHCDFLTIWMFRHKKTRRICFAINRHKYPVDGKLSKRISKATSNS